MQSDILLLKHVLQILSQSSQVSLTIFVGFATNVVLQVESVLYSVHYLYCPSGQLLKQ